MSIYHKLGSCGVDVFIHPSVHIEHPEVFHLGDRVKIMAGAIFHGKQKEIRLGDDSIIWPNFFMQGKGSLITEHKVEFYPGTYISVTRETGFVKVGHTSHFAAGCALWGAAGLTIGPECAFAAHTVITTVAHDHRVIDRPIVKTGRSAPIVIEGDFWSGANATIVPGVTVARGCVLGAGGVLTKDTEPYGVYLGVPARLAYKRK